MSNKVDIYFTNGHMARLPANKTMIFKEMPDQLALAEYINADYSLVNWNNVCFTRKTPEFSDDDD